MEMNEESYKRLYNLIKDPDIDDQNREHALGELLEEGSDRAEEMLITLANDGYLKFELRNIALDYCFRFKKSRCARKQDDKE